MIVRTLGKLSILARGEITNRSICSQRFPEPFEPENEVTLRECWRTILVAVGERDEGCVLVIVEF